MTLFYLLSGYTLTLAYGGRGDWSWADIIGFYWNRVIRIAPSFYLSNIVAFFIAGNYKTIMLRVPQLVTTLTITNSWIMPGIENFNPFNGPSWTVSTLTMMYLAFPLILPHIKKMSDARLASSLVILYYVQLLPAVYMLFFDLTKER